MSARAHRRTSSEGAAAGAAPHHIAHVPLLGIDHDHEDMVSLVDRRSDYYRRSALAEHLETAAAASAAKGRGGRRGAAGAAGNRAGPAPSSGAPGAGEALLNLPNVLTLSRLVFVPVIGLLWYSEHPSHPLACALLFVAASLTDWLDGYLARRLELTSAFGAFLDPVADKVMVSTALVLLATTPPAPLSPRDLAAPVVIIIAREITISALREWAASLGAGSAAGGGIGGGQGGGGMRAAVKVNSLGKWKTALQMAAMSALMLGRDRSGCLAAFLDGAARAVGAGPCAGGGGGVATAVPGAAAGGGAALGGGAAGAGRGIVAGIVGKQGGFASTLARAFGSMAGPPPPPPPPPAAAAVLAAAPGASGLFCLRRAFTPEAVVLGAWVALWGAALLAVWSGAVYFRAAWGAFSGSVHGGGGDPAAHAPAAEGAGLASPRRAPRLGVPDTPLTDGPAAAAGSPRTPLRRSTRR